MITVAPGALATPGVCGFGPGFNRGFFGLRFGFNRGFVGPRFGFLGLASLSGRASSRRHRRRGRRGARGLSGHTCGVRNRDALSEQLPLVAPDNADTYIVPALIANAGDAAGLRYVEFLTANINNPHTRRAYARACGRFFAGCERRGLTLGAIRPFDVAAWMKELQETLGAPGCEAAARRCAYAARLADNRPGGADESGRRPTASRPKPCANCTTAR